MMSCNGVLAHYHNTLMQSGPVLGLGHFGTLPGVPIQSHNTFMQPGQVLGVGHFGTLPGIPVILANSLEVSKQELGSGAFGTVNYGRWNGRPVAIKTKNFEMTSEDFVQEAKVMRILQHDNLVKIYGIVFEEEIHPVNGVTQVATRIVMEYMCNGDLLEYFFFKQGQPILVRDLLNMAKQIASFLAHMEFMGYVHGDLHARNILVGENGVCKVADLGKARHVSQSGYNAHRSNYPTAPELIARDGYGPTIETDVHSFGLLMHCIFTRL